MSRKMKDSGIEWIGEIPEDWEIRNLKAILAERKERNNPIKTEFILSLTKDRGVIPYTEKGDIGNKSKDDLTGYMLAYPKDIVLNSMNVIIGSVGLSKYFGAVSPVYYMLYSRNSDDSIEYYNQIFQTDTFQGKLKGYGNGILEHRMRIPMINLNTVLLPYPKSEEQHKIANFLDKKVAEIDHILEKTRESIEEYKKYKQSIITEAVTKGLNPDAKMKDSGIEWIGEIPEHWDITKIKYISNKIGSGKTPFGGANVYSDEGIMFLRSQNVYNECLSIDDVVYISKEIDEDMKNTRVYNGDILLNITGGSIGRATIYPFNDYANVNQHVCIIRVGSDIVFNKLIHYILISNIGFNAINVYQSGANREGLNFEQIGNFDIPLMDIEEQTEIINYLDIRCSNIDSLISLKQRLLSDLEAYKKSLIYECVTGKREVV